MAKPRINSVDDYIASQPESAQGVLQRVRSIIRKALPAAEEVISYQIPAYRLHGGLVIYFAGWKKHYSLYPVNAEVVVACKGDPASYDVKKGTIRFLLTDPIPAKLIERIAKFRAKEIAKREKSKPKPPRR